MLRLLRYCSLFTLDVCEHFFRKCLRYPERTKHVIYKQVKKTFDFSCDALKWTVIKLW